MEPQRGTGWEGTQRVTRSNLPAPAGPSRSTRHRITAPSHDTARGKRLQAHSLAPRTGGQTRVWVPLVQTPGGFYPHLRVGLSLDHGSRPRPVPAPPGRPRAPDPPALRLRPRPPRLRRPWPGTARDPEGRGPRGAASCQPSRRARHGNELPSAPEFPHAGLCPAQCPFPCCKTPCSRARVVIEYRGSSCSCSEPQQIQPLLSPNPPQAHRIIAGHTQTPRILT